MRVLVSFYASREDGSVRSEPLHKEKFSVPVSEARHQDLHEFKRHLMSFADIKEIAVEKGIGMSIVHEYRVSLVYQRTAKVA